MPYVPVQPAVNGAAVDDQMLTDHVVRATLELFPQPSVLPIPSVFATHQYRNEGKDLHRLGEPLHFEGFVKHLRNVTVDADDAVLPVLQQILVSPNLLQNLRLAPSRSDTRVVLPLDLHETQTALSLQKQQVYLQPFPTTTKTNFDVNELRLPTLCVFGPARESPEEPGDDPTLLPFVSGLQLSGIMSFAALLEALSR